MKNIKPDPAGNTGLLKTLEEELRRKNQELEVLADISDAYAKVIGEYKSVLDHTVKKVSSIFGDTCIIRLLTEDGDRLKDTAYYNPDDAIMQFMHDLFSKVPYDSVKGSAEKVIKEGVPVLISEVKSREDFQPLQSAYAEYWNRFGLSSILMVPLKVQNKTIGMISLFRSIPGKPYTKEDQIFVSSVAIKVALAIFNNRQLKKNTSEIGRKTMIQEALFSQQELLQNILATIPVGIWVFDHNGRRIVANKAVKDIWGEIAYDRSEDLVNFKAWWTDSGEKVRPDEWASVKALRGESVLNQRITIISTEGAKKLILNSAVPIYKEKEIAGAIVVNVDITDLKMSN